MNDPLDLSNNNQNDNSSRIKKLQEKLYSPNTQFQIRQRQNLKRHIDEGVKEEWQKDEEDLFANSIPEKKMSFFAKFAIFAFVFFLGATGFAFFKLNSGNQIASLNDVEVNVIGPVSIVGGEELSLDIIITNRNSFPINTVDVVIEYPEGTKLASDLKTDLPRFRELVGDIEPNSSVKKTYSAALFGEEGQNKEISVKAEYRIPNSNAIFESKKNFSLALQSSPIRLVVDTVKESTSGQALEFDVTVSSNSNNDLKNVLVSVDYPFGFSFSESTLKPAFGNDTWYFENMKPQESQKFTVRGILSGQNNEERVFKWNAGLADENSPEKIGVAFISLPKSISLIKPFLALDMSIDGDFNVDLVRDGATQINGRLTYTNNTGAVINDAQIVLKLDGEVLDDSSVQVSGGFFNSTDNTITWNKTTNPNLFTEIPVAKSETLTFTFKTKTLATRQAVYKNPEIILNASISGRRVAEEDVPEDIKVEAAKRIKIASDVVLDILTSYSGEPFANSGPIPPKVEKETTYTLTLNVTNSSNALERGKVRATLPPYVRWNNNFIPSSEKISFDPVSRTLEWDLGDIREHAGFIDPSRNVAVQLALTPSATQVGEAPALLLNPTFYAFDTFTQKEINVVSANPNTDLGKAADIDDAKVVQ